MEVIHNYGGNTQRINKLQHNLSIHHFPVVALNQSNIKTSNVNNKIVKSN